MRKPLHDGVAGVDILSRREDTGQRFVEKVDAVDVSAEVPLSEVISIGMTPTNIVMMRGRHRGKTLGDASENHCIRLVALPVGSKNQFGSLEPRRRDKKYSCDGSVWILSAPSYSTLTRSEERLETLLKE